MLPIVFSLVGTLFIVTGLQMRARGRGTSKAQWSVLISGLFGVAVVYVNLTWQEPLWVRLGIPTGVLVGGILAMMRSKRWARRQEAGS